ncbi:hypothetical protein [Streptomyces sulphureus]|uniref:hypothetical protein n=1 Tax=Streptomyces sulphureus TaxID=47758 RepID=UPI0003A79E39|nr:hypothetical protein [Streptomyces sulphureus]
MVATRILWALSGRRFGPSCPITVRPCRRSCTESLTPSGIGYGVVGPWVPYIGVDGLWRNASVCGCRSDCSCTELCEVQLQGPVYDVLSVMIDGAELVPEAYRVDEPGLLVRTDDGCWPDCQDMAAACDAEGTFCVTYRTGLPLDEAAVAAVSEYACHLAKGCGTAGGSCGCRPNPNLTRIQRQGVEIERADPSVVYAEGRVGLPLVDQWLVAVNPGRLGSASRAYSVDWRWPRRTRWP